MFSILIPSYNNLNYLKLCIKSILKNSINKHEIIVHVNEGSDGTLEYVKNNNLNYTFTNKNVGLCTAINSSAKNIDPIKKNKEPKIAKIKVGLFSLNKMGTHKIRYSN